jgi:hypothetical protein
MNFKNYGLLEVGLTKWSVIFFALFLVSAWPEFTKWVMGVNWAWFLIISLVLAIKPLKTFFKK